jgi:NUDIX domain
MAASRSLHFSPDFCISCGTITVDLRAQKVLLLFYRSTGEYLLPKGHKNINETMEAAAVRETLEETGIRCELLPHSFPHQATPFVGEAEASSAAGRMTTEPIAVQQRTSQGAWKIIFWFVAQADSTVARVEGMQEDYEQYDTVWADVGSAPGMMSREDDGEVVKMVIESVLGLGKST